MPWPLSDEKSWRLTRSSHSCSRAHLLQGARRRAALQLVGLGEQDMDRHALVVGPAQQGLVELGERMAHVHHQHQAAQRGAALQVVGEVALPLQLDLLRHLGEAVAGKVHQAAVGVVPQAEEVDQLGPARGLGGSGQGLLAGQGVDGTGLAGVGAAGEGHLGTAVVGALGQGGSTGEKTGGLVVESRHGDDILTMVEGDGARLAFPRPG
jgi:hypothetical protein